jgi:hypothetical protein
MFEVECPPLAPRSRHLHDIILLSPRLSCTSDTSLTTQSIAKREESTHLEVPARSFECFQTRSFIVPRRDRFKLCQGLPLTRCQVCGRHVRFCWLKPRSRQLSIGELGISRKPRKAVSRFFATTDRSLASNRQRTLDYRQVAIDTTER